MEMIFLLFQAWSYNKNYEEKVVQIALTEMFRRPNTEFNLIKHHQRNDFKIELKSLNVEVQQPEFKSKSMCVYMCAYTDTLLGQDSEC